MSEDASIPEFVMASEVRTTVLRTLTEGVTSSADLIAGIDASESAVYNALTGLEERGLIRTTEPGWELTGAGTVIADLLWVVDRTDRLLDIDRAYWRTHDPTVLPASFRRRLLVFQDGEVLRATDADPERVIREIARTMATAETVDVITPVYHSQYAEAVTTGEDPPSARLVFDRTLLEELRENPPTTGREPPESVDIRVRDGVPFALAITDERVLLSLPTMDGEYDARTEVAATCQRARRWGEELFANYWESATPLEEIV